MVLAQQLNDSLLLAEAIFAQGRVYDAWNREQDKTIERFSEAYRLFSKFGSNYTETKYVHYLIAHAYEKRGDSASTLRVLNELYEECLQLPDSTKQELIFIPLMALSSIEVGNATFAKKVFKNLTHPSWIKNDKQTYDYKDLYYLIRAKIDILFDQKKSSPFIDSLVYVYNRATTPYDSLFYCHALFDLFNSLGNHKMAVKYLEQGFYVKDNIYSNVDIDKLRIRLDQAERESIDKTEQISLQLQYFKNILLTLFAVLTVILLYFLRKTNKQKVELATFTHSLNRTNLLLDKKAEHNVVLNKELNHRVKNNLYMVYSLLQMQERKASHPETKKNLKATQSRIDSLALVHQILSDQQGEINVGQMTRKIVESLNTSSLTGKSIDLHIKGGLYIVESTIGSPLTLILNELITNSIKHSDTQESNLTINLEIKSAEDQTVISYSDNGTPSDSERQAHGIGLEIIELLSRQIGCKVRRDGNFNYELILKSND